MTSKDCDFRLTSKEWANVEELTSDHKKSDTKMLLCAKHASILHGKVLISIQETGKLIMTLGKITEVAAHIHKLNGIRINRLITDVNGLTGNLDAFLNMTNYSKEKLLVTLAGIHCFTAFDTFNAIPEKIKLRLLCMMCKENKYIATFKSFVSIRLNHNIVKKISFSRI